MKIYLYKNSPFQTCIAETTIYCMGISGGTHVQRGWSPPRHTRYLIRCQLPRTSGTCRILHQLDNNGSHHRRRRGECAVERGTAKEEQSPLTRKQGHSPEHHNQSVKRVRYALFNSLDYMTEYFTNLMTLYLFNCTSRNRKTKVRTSYSTRTKVTRRKARNIPKLL